MIHRCGDPQLVTGSDNSAVQVPNFAVSSPAVKVNMKRGHLLSPSPAD